MVTIIMFDVLQDCVSRFPKLDFLKPEQIKALQSFLAGYSEQWAF